MLEKIAGISLVEKLRGILLMEADFNYFNKWAFGYEAINVITKEGYCWENHKSVHHSGHQTCGGF